MGRRTKRRGPAGAKQIVEEWRAPESPSAAKAVAENRLVIATVNRCATQKQKQNRVFQHSVKPG